MGGGSDVTYTNPGNVDYRVSNPDIGAEVDYLRSMRNQYRSEALNALSPENAAARVGRAQEQSRTAIANRFAQSGLAQSSAAYGAAQESDISIQRAYDEQRIQDMLRSLQVEAALSGQISGNIFGVQNQYGQAEAAANAAIMQQNAQEQAMWGQIIGAGAMVGGTLLAGPVGGMAAGSLVGGMGGGGASPAMAPMPQYQPAGPSVGGAYGMYGGGGF